MMTEGDFIYTPHQMANENQQADLYYEEDEDYDYYDDAFVIGDEGVMVMSASAPDASQFMAADDDDEEQQNIASSIVMDENMWMGHSRYNTNGLTLHVVNPDNDDDVDDEEDDPMYHSVTSSNNPYKSIVSYQGQLQMVKEEDEEEDEEEEEEEESSEEEEQEQVLEDIPTKLSMSPEVLHWYRSADIRPPTITVEDKSIEDAQCKNNCGCSSTSSNSSTTSTCSNNSKSDEVEKTATRRSSDSYQSLADIIEEEQLRDYGTLPTYHNRSIVTSTNKKVSALMQVSVCFVDAAWVAMDIAQTYAENSSENKSVTGFINCLFKIWKALFLGAETMLGWGNHRLKPQAMV
ncbi:hypothetical protein EDC94DRAFT_629963 [Helicostylum pulchrum]|nr:hypothetical protein EDC94DRAFT_629963 [Helicostylum pulchrum]